MQVQVIYYLDVLSSWCFWVEPVWAEVQRRYADRVAFDWRIAQMRSEAFPKSKAQCDWFYRRSGTLNRSPFMLNSGWFEPDRNDYSAPNRIAEAARELGARDDQVRLALARAAVIAGRPVGQMAEALAVACTTANLDPDRLARSAQSDEILERVRATTDEFFRLQIDQRPAFRIENEIGDRATLSGLVALEPLAATIDAMLSDAQGYASWAAHFGPPPEG